MEEIGPPRIRSDEKEWRNRLGTNDHRASRVPKSGPRGTPCRGGFASQRTGPPAKVDLRSISRRMNFFSCLCVPCCTKVPASGRLHCIWLCVRWRDAVLRVSPEPAKNREELK